MQSAPSDRLVRDAAVAQDADERHGQRRGDEERHRQQVGQPDERLRVDEEHERREHDAREDRQPLALVDRLAGVGVADRDDERDGGEERAADRAPARVVDHLEQEEVREEQHEQAVVAVGQAEGSLPHCSRP